MNSVVVYPLTMISGLSKMVPPTPFEEWPQRKGAYLLKLIGVLAG